MKILVLILATGLILPTFVRADDETGFDALVKELKSDLKDEPVTQAPASQHIMAGVALSGDYVAVGSNGAPSGGALLGGFDLHGGIELSPVWLAEASFVSFGSGRMATDYSASLQEFDVRLVNQSEIRRHLFMRIGAGLSAEFLKTMDNRNQQNSQGTEQVPALALLAGVDRELSPKVSVGPDISYHAPLSRGTADRGSADAALRMNFHF